MDIVKDLVPIARNEVRNTTFLRIQTQCVDDLAVLRRAQYHYNANYVDDTPYITDVLRLCLCAVWFLSQSGLFSAPKATFVPKKLPHAGLMAHLNEARRATAGSRSEIRAISPFSRLCQASRWSAAVARRSLTAIKTVKRRTGSSTKRRARRHERLAFPSDLFIVMFSCNFLVDASLSDVT